MGLRSLVFAMAMMDGFAKGASSAPTAQTLLVLIAVAGIIAMRAARRSATHKP